MAFLPKNGGDPISTGQWKLITGPFTSFPHVPSFIPVQRGRGTFFVILGMATLCLLSHHTENNQAAAGWEVREKSDF